MSVHVHVGPNAPQLHSEDVQRSVELHCAEQIAALQSYFSDGVIQVEVPSCTFKELPAEQGAVATLVRDKNKRLRHSYFEKPRSINTLDCDTVAGLVEESLSAILRTIEADSTVVPAANVA